MERSDLEMLAKGELTPELFIELMRLYPDMARGAHRQLAHDDPVAYRLIIPDIFDEQTGLFSKSYLEGALLDASIKATNESGFTFCYGILDIDNFKTINDEYGSDAGDSVINEVSNIIVENLRTYERRQIHEPIQVNRRHQERREHTNTDYIGFHGGRIGGGEEFGLILPWCNYRTAFSVMDRLREGIANLEIPYKEEFIRVTASGGISQYKKDMLKEALIENANRALRTAKKTGKNRISGYKPILF